MSNTASEETRFCKSCKKTKPHEEFVGMKDLSYVKTCKACREMWKRNDQNRDKERRNELARVCAKKPENIARKKTWENANPEKIEQKYKKIAGQTGYSRYRRVFEA
jgi:NMD protein affecting ribosome stability and mRNA decay